MTEVRTQPELDALEAVRLAIEEARDKVHSLFGGYDYSSYGRTPPLVVRDERKRESRIIWEGDDREESERQYRKATGDYIAQAAISAYLSALSAQGMRVMPREPTPAMHVRGMDCRRVQDNLNKVHSVIIDTSEIWREMFDAAYGGAK